MNEAEKVLGFAFPASRNATPALEPGKQAFNLPTTFVAAQLATIGLVVATGLLVGRDEVDASLHLESLLKSTSVPRLVCNQARRQLLYESSIESSLGEHTVESVSFCNMDSEWKTIAVCDRHEFRRPTSTAFADTGPPFFAGT